MNITVVDYCFKMVVLLIALSFNTFLLYFRIVTVTFEQWKRIIKRFIQVKSLSNVKFIQKNLVKLSTLRHIKSFMQLISHINVMCVSKDVHENLS